MVRRRSGAMVRRRSPAMVRRRSPAALAQPPPAGGERPAHGEGRQRPGSVEDEEVEIGEQRVARRADPVVEHVDERDGSAVEQPAEGEAAGGDPAQIPPGARARLPAGLGLSSGSQIVDGGRGLAHRAGRMPPPSPPPPAPSTPINWWYSLVVSGIGSTPRSSSSCAQSLSYCRRTRSRRPCLA